jgi:AcrR family transcriptional regulator
MTGAGVDDPVARRAPFGHPVVGERGGDTRRRILEGTLEALAEVGFAEVRVERIAERAGCSRPAFYQYFSSKHDVFWALAGQLGDEMVALAGALDPVTRDAPGVAHLTDWIAEFMALHARWAPVFASFQAAGREDGTRVRRSIGIGDRTAQALLRAFGRDDDAADIRLMGGLVAVLIRSSFYAERAPATVSLRPLVTSLAELVHRVLVGPIDGVNVDRRGPVRRGRITVAARTPRPSAAPLPPRSARTRQRLLDAGLVVLATRGYHDTRVDDIAAEAGLSHGSFYRYFDSKDDFFQALAEPAAARAVALVDRLDLDCGRDELRAWLETWFHTYEADGGIISTWQEMRTDGVLAAFSTQVAATLFVRLVALLERRDFGHPEADATVLLATLERLPYVVYTLGFASEAEGIDVALTVMRRGFRALAD